MIRCQFILVTGERKGKLCGNKEYYQGYCQRHSYKLGITSEAERVKCSAVYKSGLSKGKQCKNTAKYKGYCHLHAKSKNICIIGDSVVDNADLINMVEVPSSNSSSTTNSTSVDEITGSISVIQISSENPSLPTENEVINECKICMERQINTLIMPCKHSCMCDRCAINNSTNCPICRAHIEKIITFYNC